MYMNSTPSVKYEIIYDTIKNDNNMLNISQLCTLAGVSRSGFYKWISSEKKMASKELQDETDFDLILTASVQRLR